MAEEEHETPTKPENADPMVAIVGRIEGKVDRLTNLMQTLFDELQVYRQKLEDMDERVSFMEGIGDGG